MMKPSKVLPTIFVMFILIASIQAQPTGATTIVSSTNLIQDTHAGQLTVPTNILAPSTPQNLAATAVSTTEIVLTWQRPAASENVDHYKIYRDDKEIATTDKWRPFDTYTVTGLQASTPYSFYVVAYNTTGDPSPQSSTTAATTLTAPRGPTVIYVDNTLTADITDGHYSIADRNRSESVADGNAYNTIQAAINVMQPGDTAYLREGTFQEHSINLRGKQGSESAWFTISSYPGEWAIVDGGHPEEGNGVNVFQASSAHQYAPIYWRFEYFEVTGAGPSAEGKTYEDIHSLRGAGFHFWPGYHMVFDHLYIHDNYGGGGPNGGAGIKFQNEGGTAVHDVVITHCYLKDNGWPGSGNHNLANIIFFSDYVGDPAQVNIYEALSRNEISYNLIEGSAIGFKNKNSQRLVRNHIGDDMEAQEWGDKIHHNILIDNPEIGILVSQDFAQIHHNIVVSSTSGIILGEPPSSGDREPFHTVVYNNLVIGSASGGGITSYHGLDSSIGTYTTEPWHPFWYVWNNIIENGKDGDSHNDINILFTWPSGHQVDMNTVQVDHNYFYPRARTDNVIDVVGPSNDYSADQYEAQGWATNLYANLVNGADPLHPASSAYKTRQEHILEESTTIANGGYGQAHPYLTEATLPSYVGPCADNDCAWVNEVAELEDLPHLTPNAAAVTDLRVAEAITTTNILTATLTWTAPTNAITYTLRYANTPLTEANWSGAPLITVPSTASTPGSTEHFTLTIPYTDGTAFFAIKSQNDAGAWSSLSNNAFWPYLNTYLPILVRNQ